MMYIAGGIDIGGTKIEAQLFDENWELADSKRVATPKSYTELLDAIKQQVEWLRSGAPDRPVGVAVAGMLNPANGHWIAANLAAHDRPLSVDLSRVCSADVSLLNDCRAFVLAESVFGAGSSKGVTLGLLLGTGIGGAITVDGRLINDGEGQSGEFGHIPMSADIVARHELPILTCGCGRRGCYETLGSGPGLARLATHFTGKVMTGEQVANGRSDPAIAGVWDAWCAVNAALIYNLQTVVDPCTIVLGGGLSRIDGIVEDLERHLSHLKWPGFALAKIRTGSRGETAAALGAAYTAWKEHGHG